MSQEKLKKEVEDLAVDGYLTCQQAFQISEKLNCSPLEVGKKCDEMEIKIAKCQLGCF